jgi:hypothetical protein
MPWRECELVSDKQTWEVQTAGLAKHPKRELFRIASSLFFAGIDIHQAKILGG